MSELTVHDGRDPLFIGLLVLVSIFLGVFFRICLRKLPIPYTLLCLVLGIIIGEIHEYAGLGAFGYSVNRWMNLDPHTILFLFLPPLIYESAASLDCFTFRHSIIQTLLLAVPGVLISALLTAVIAMYVLPHNWNFVTSMAFGSILAATDPVAVVALLKELGAERSLATIIEGESLLNDGVAFVLFEFFLKEMEGDSQSTGDFFSSFIYKSFVGFLVGLILGKIMSFLMGLIFDDAVSEVMLSVAGAFGAFYFVEGLIQASGVLGVVGFGISFAASKSGNISVAAAESLEHVWESLGFLANTLVFVYSGIIISFYSFHTDAITGEEYGYLILLYLLLHVVRGITIALLSPLLARFGYGFNWKHGVLFTWAGLRGAVGLTLGLFVVNDDELDETTRARIMFYIAGIAGLTLLINGTTSGYVVRELQLDRSSAAAKVFYTNIVRRVKEHVDSIVAVARRDDYFKGAEWSSVWRRMPILSKSMLHSVEINSGEPLSRKQLKRTQKLLKDIDRSFANSSEDEMQRSLIQDARHRFLNLVKANYQEEFEHGALESRPAFQILYDAATAAQDCGLKQTEWYIISQHCAVNRWLGWIPISSIRSILIDWKLRLGYELAVIFIKAHIAVEHEIDELIGSEEIIDIVLSESRAQMRSAQSYLDDLNTEYAEITGAFKTRWATQWVLRDMYVFVQELYENGEIDMKELKRIHRSFELSRRNMFVERFVSFSKPLQRIQVLRNSDLFEGMMKEDINTVINLCHEYEFLSEERIAIEGEQCKGIFVITNGKVQMSSIIQGKPIVLRTLTSGDIIGDVSIATKLPNKWTTTCCTHVRGFMLKAQHIYKLFEKCHGKQFERNIFLLAGMNIIRSYYVLETGTSLPPEKINSIMHESEILKPSEGEQITREDGIGVLFRGNGKRILNMTKEEKQEQDLELETDVQAICKFDFHGAWSFHQDAIVLWIPASISWVLIPEENLSRVSTQLGRCRTSASYASGRRSNYTPRSRTRTHSYVSKFPRTPRTPRLRLSKRTTSNISDRSSPSGSSSIPNPSDIVIPRNFTDDSWAGITDLNASIPPPPPPSSSSLQLSSTSIPPLSANQSSQELPIPETIQTPITSPSVFRRSRWYSTLESP